MVELSDIVVLHGSTCSIHEVNNRVNVTLQIRLSVDLGYRLMIVVNGLEPRRGYAKSVTTG